MSTPKGFVFKLQPKLDQWAEQEDVAERLLVLALQEQREREGNLRVAREKMANGVQRLRSARDNSPDDPGFNVIEAGRYVSTMEVVVVGLRSTVQAKEQELEEANRLLALRRKELGEIQQAIESLERLRDKQIEEYLQEADRTEELARDEAAIQAWTRQQQVRPEE